MGFADYVFIGASVVVGVVLALGIFIVIPVMLYFAVAYAGEWITKREIRRRRATQVQPAWITEWCADLDRREAK